MTPLERMYPNRCFDCLTPIPLDRVLCAQCEPPKVKNIDGLRQAPDEVGGGP